MVQKLTCALNSNDDTIIRQFIDRLLLIGIHSTKLKPSDKYCYLEVAWDDSNTALSAKPHNIRNAGAKPKILQHNGLPVTCGLVYQLRKQKHLSDSQIGALFDISESTICRRRKKHTSDGNFYEGSNTIF